MPKTNLQRSLDGASRKNRRRGHKSDDTRKDNAKEFRQAMGSIAEYSEFEIANYGGRVNRTIKRTPTGSMKQFPAEFIDFDKAVFELSAYAEIVSPDGEFENLDGKQVQFALTQDDTFLFPSLRGALGELFDEGATIKTQKAIYEMATRKVELPDETLFISLNDRTEEFRSALKRGFDSNLTVYADFDKDCWVVVNAQNATEYRVKLASIEDKALGRCECADFNRRGRICKHISEVLIDRFYPILERLNLIESESFSGA